MMGDRRAASGDEGAERFRAVVLPHLADALAFARWLTGNAADAEDVVQESCMRALAGIGGYAGGNAKAWLLAIVRNTSMTWLARNRPRGAVPLDEAVLPEDPPEDGVFEPEAALIAAADAAALEAAIAALPPPFREVLVLRDLNGLSYREIADMLTIPIGTVMSRLARARTTLVRAFGSEP